MRVFFIFMMIVLSFVLREAKASSSLTMKDSHQPILMKADELTYDSLQETVIAQGNVEISQYVPDQGWRVLRSENVLYNQKKNEIIAKGNVKLKEPTGDIITADEVVFTGDFKEGVSKALHIWTNDQAQLAASRGKRENGCESEFEKAVYSPCKFCKVENNNQYPLWQIKADKVIHDQAEQKVIYKHARLEIKGVPIFYLPYFSHADPTVKRKSGLLFPTYGMSKDLGTLISLPAFYAIAPNRDLTLTPMLTTKQGPVMITEYRHRFYQGEAKFAGSYTKSHGLNKQTGPIPFNGPRPPKSDRWHLASKINYDISDERRLLLDFSRASDTTYLSRYPITRQTPAFAQSKNMTSMITVEQFKDENYISVKGASFQTDTPKTTPIVLPAITYHQQIQPDKMGGILSFDSNFLALSRQTPIPGRFGTEMQRVSTGVTWKLPYVTKSGQLITLNLSGRADGYYTRRYQLSTRSPAPGFNSSLEHTQGRLFPQASLDWRYPLLKRLNQSDWIFQPMGMLVSSPYQLNNTHIPNEDSNSFELDDTTLFLPNRFDGIDRIDSGNRLVYGFDNSFYFPKQKLVNVFIGQDRRLDRKQVVPIGLGEDIHKSDYVGRIKIKPISWFEARYRTAIKPGNNRPRYSELGFKFGDARLNLDLGYVFLNKKSTINKKDISQLNWKIGTEIVENWSVSFAQIRNLQKSQGSRDLANFISATYKDECFQLDAGVYKTSYRDRDIHPDSGFLVKLTFKNLGSFAPSAAPQYPGSMLTSF